MIQKNFADKAVEIWKNHPNVIGLAVAGSWITNEIDPFSDLDLVLVTSEPVSERKTMRSYAEPLGHLLAAFTGEHVGEPRLLICLYDEPLLHVDIKFITLPELETRVEDPVIIFERDNQLTQILHRTKAAWPYPDYQWMEDRFWIWVHYATLKIGRGEYFEALDFLSFIRQVVLGPLLQIKNGYLPKGVRKVEQNISKPDLELLKSTIAQYEPTSIASALEQAIHLYQSLQQQLFPATIQLQKEAQSKSIAYLQEIKTQHLNIPV